MELPNQILVWFLNFLGSVGIILIVYGVVAAKYGSPYPLLESIADWVTLVVTLSGVFLTAFSIYIPSNTRPPDKLSTHFTAPLAILAILFAFVYAFRNRKLLPRHVLNGFAILGLAGACSFCLQMMEDAAVNMESQLLPLDVVELVKMHLEL